MKRTALLIPFLLAAISCNEADPGAAAGALGGAKTEPTELKMVEPGTKKIVAPDMIQKPGTREIVAPDMVQKPGTKEIVAPDMIQKPGTKGIVAPDMIQKPGTKGIVAPDMIQKPGLIGEDGSKAVEPRTR